MTPAGEVIEEHVVARIPDSDEDWSPKVLQAKEEAEERAFHLNTWSWDGTRRRQLHHGPDSLVLG